MQSLCCRYATLRNLSAALNYLHDEITCFLKPTTTVLADVSLRSIYLRPMIHVCHSNWQYRWQLPKVSIRP